MGPQKQQVGAQHETGRGFGVAGDMASNQKRPLQAAVFWLLPVPTAYMSMASAISTEPPAASSGQFLALATASS